jgi:membrane protease YdiL (CAAX protease family)
MFSEIYRVKRESALWIADLNRKKAGLLLTPVIISIILLTLDRFGLQRSFYNLFNYKQLFSAYSPNELNFIAQIYFSSACVSLFIIVPSLFHFIFPSGVKNPFGLGVGYSAKHKSIYVTLLILMLPIIWVAAGDRNFNNFYPMYKPSSLELWLYYELIYMLHFISVEFFFRGFMLFRFQQMFSGYAVVMMIIPYSLLHIHKPFPEAMASIVGGCALGYLALKTRSIWPGVMVHCGVALSMDWFGLIRSGRMTSLLPW